jgi:hypothetical protein
VSATLIDGGPAGPDEAGGQYRNRILTDRAAWWEAMGRRQGVRRGFDWSVLSGQLALQLTAGLGTVEERDTLGSVGTGRGYAVWTDDAQVATFGAPSASARVDAVVLAFVDVSVGTAALGTETSTVGGQIVVVPGDSGTLTNRTDAQISAAVGSGGWVRLLDVRIDPGDTEVNPANVARNAVGYLSKWRALTGYQSGWSGNIEHRYLDGIVYLRGSATRSSGSGTTIGTLPIGVRPVANMSMSVRHGSGSSHSLTFIIRDNGELVVGSAATNDTAVFVDGITYPEAGT